MAKIASIVNPDINDIINTMNLGMENLINIMYNVFNQIVEQITELSQEIPSIQNAQNKFKILTNKQMLAPMDESNWLIGDQDIGLTPLTQQNPVKSYKHLKRL